MITHLKLANFRLFNRAVELRIRPITILIGRNSAGKSSAIKFLSILKQSLGNNTSDFLDTDGECTQFGIFKNVRNVASKKPYLHFDVEVQTQAFDGKDALFHLEGQVPYGANGSKGYQTLRVCQAGGEDAVLTESPLADNASFLRFTPELLRRMQNGNGAGLAVSEKMPAYDVAAGMKDAVWSRHVESFRAVVGRLQHLGPVRQEPRRVADAANPPREYVGYKGQYALPHLGGLLKAKGGSKEKKMLNKYLSSIARIEKPEFVQGAMGSLEMVFAKNAITGAKCYLSDFGFGVNQVLPVLVQGLIMSPQSQLMVEEPEAQLHPTAQLELGSYFADIWNQRKVASIIETHSDNILLRLRRLIAKGELNPEHVSVAFFDVDDNGMPFVKNLDIEADGSMKKGLPMKFFHASIGEALHMRVGK